MEPRVEPIQDNTGAFVISNGEITETLPKSNKNQKSSADLLHILGNDVGMPVDLRTDMDTSFISRHIEFLKIRREEKIKLTHGKLDHHNQLYKVYIEIK